MAEPSAEKHFLLGERDAAKEIVENAEHFLKESQDLVKFMRQALDSSSDLPHQFTWTQWIVVVEAYSHFVANQMQRMMNWTRKCSRNHFSDEYAEDD